jgi:hypothetical protein
MHNLFDTVAQLYFFFCIDLFSIDPGIFSEECRTRGRRKIVSLDLALQFQISTPTIAQKSDLISALISLKNKDPSHGISKVHTLLLPNGLRLLVRSEQ